MSGSGWVGGAPLRRAAHSGYSPAVGAGAVATN
jgi:hypothetical protein